MACHKVMNLSTRLNLWRTRSGRPYRIGHRRGMALIAVLWLVAAMSLIISGVIRSVRSDAQAVGLQRQTLLASARGDAALLLALQSLHAEQKELPKTQKNLPVEFDGQTFQVQVTPLNGLVDINRVQLALLSALYLHAGGANPAQALALAQDTLATRDRLSLKGIPTGFAATDDLMSVPGMNYDLYAKVAPLVTAVIKNGGGRVNPLAAPLGVLDVLAEGNSTRANQFMTQRDAAGVTADGSFFKPEWIDMSASKSMRFEVSVELPDGAHLQRSWHVYWDTDPRTNLPWRVLSKQQLLQSPHPDQH
jgi:general secretion pathway protein K